MSTGSAVGLGSGGAHEDLITPAAKTGGKAAARTTPTALLPHPQHVCPAAALQHVAVGESDGFPDTQGTSGRLGMVSVRPQGWPDFLWTVSPRDGAAIL